MHRFLLPCVDHTSTGAEPRFGDHYDVATALITRAEDVKWGEAAVRYAAKGEAEVEEEVEEDEGEVEEAEEEVEEERLGSSEVPFDGAHLTLAEVRKHEGRLKRAGGSSSLFAGCVRI